MSKPSIVDRVTTLALDAHTTDLLIEFTDGGETKSIVFPRAQIPGLLIGLLGLQSSQASVPLAIPSIYAERVQAYRDADGTAGLMFVLRGDWVLPLAIPSDAVSGLRQDIDTMEQLRPQQPGPARHYSFGRPPGPRHLPIAPPIGRPPFS